MAKTPVSDDDANGITKGKPPRNALLVIGVIAALVIGAMGFYYQTKDAAAADAAAAAKRAEKAAASTQVNPNDEDVDKIIADQQAAAEAQAKKQHALEAAEPHANPRADLSADDFVRDAHVEQLQKGESDDALYTAPIFKAGEKIKPAGQGNANAEALNPMQMMLEQQQAAKAQSAARAQGVMPATTGSSATNIGKATDMQFLKDTAAQSKAGNSFTTRTFVGRERGCTLAPPNHIDVLTHEAGNSDRPGTISLMVDEDIYDSVRGDCLMIPRGTMINAPYSSDIAPGQESLLVAATDMTLPNGKEVPLDGAPGADPNGYNGFSAHVNNHFLKIYGTSFLTAILVKKYDDSSTSTTTTGLGVTQVNSTAGQVAATTAQSVLQRYQNLQPTLTVKAGQHFILKLTHRLVLEPYHYD